MPVMDQTVITAPPRTRKPRGQGASRRAEILEAAKHLFLEEGFQHATMRRIASIVGVSPTAIYLHFADKEAILAAIAEDFFAEVLAVLEVATAGDAPPLARLQTGLRAYVEFSLMRPDEYRLTFQAWATRGVSATYVKPEVADKSFHILEDSVIQLIEAGLFIKGDPLIISEAIVCSLHGLTSALLDMPKKLQSEPPALIDAVIRMTVDGFAVNKLPI